MGVEDAKIGWPARKTNEVLMGVQENRMLLQAILNRKGNWLGHTLRTGIMTIALERLVMTTSYDDDYKPSTYTIRD